jgi:hypothetical protein
MSPWSSPGGSPWSSGGRSPASPASPVDQHIDGLHLTYSSFMLYNSWSTKKAAAILALTNLLSQNPQDATLRLFITILSQKHSQSQYKISYGIIPNKTKKQAAIAEAVTDLITADGELSLHRLKSAVTDKQSSLHSALNIQRRTLPATFFGSRTLFAINRSRTLQTAIETVKGPVTWAKYFGIN